MIPGAVNPPLFNGAGAAPDGQFWNAATFGSSKYVIALYGSDVGYTSANGLSFTPMTLPQSASWDALMWNGSVFCAVAGVEGVSAFSANGTSWTASTIPFSGVSVSNNGEEAIDGVFYIWNDEILYASTDGDNWTDADLTPLVGFNRTVFNGTLYMVPSTADSVLISEDAITWEESETPLSATQVAAKSTTFCLLGGDNDIATTTDGVTYSTGTLPAVDVPSWGSLCATTNKFVVFNRGTNQYAHSSDGITWTLATLPFSGDWFAFAANGTSLLISRTEDQAPHSTLLTGL